MATIAVTSSRSSSFGRDVTTTLIANIVIGGASLLSGPLSARLLGPAGRGELAAIQNFFWVAAIVGMVGLPEATLFFSARQPQRASRVLSTSLAFCLCIAPVVITVLFFVAPYFLASQSVQVLRGARHCLWFIPIFACSTLPLFALRGSGKLDAWNILRVLPGILWLTSLTILFLAGQRSATLAAYAYVATLAATLIPTAWVIARTIVSNCRPETELLRPMLKYGLPLAAATVPQTLNSRVDQLIVAGLVPAHALGTYVVAAAWSTAVSPLLSAIATVVFPRVAAASADQQGDRLIQGTRFAVTAGIFVTAFFGVLTPWALPLLFGKAFTASVAPSLVLVFAAFVGGLNVVLDEGLRGLGDTTAILMGEVTGLVVTGSAVFLLLGRLGLMGAALASVIGCSANFVVLTFRCCRKMRMSPRNLLLPSRANLIAYASALRSLKWLRLS